jgi:hypothetical protein
MTESFAPRSAGVQRRKLILKPLFAHCGVAALVVTLAGCGSRGPQAAAPAPKIEFTSTNTLIVPPIVYGKTRDGLVLTVSDDGCEVPHLIREALQDSLHEPHEYLLPDNSKNIAGVQTLNIEIVEILANGGGIFSGPKIVEIKGALSKPDKSVAKFSARRVSFPLLGPPRSTCNIVGRDTDALGSDVAQWLAKPVDGARLGDR